MVYQGFVNHCTTIIGGDHLWRLPETSIQLFFVTRFLDLWSVFVPVFPGVLMVSFYDQPMPGVALHETPGVVTAAGKPRSMIEDGSEEGRIQGQANGPRERWPGLWVCVGFTCHKPSPFINGSINAGDFNHPQMIIRVQRCGCLLVNVYSVLWCCF